MDATPLRMLDLRSILFVLKAKVTIVVVYKMQAGKLVDVVFLFMFCFVRSDQGSDDED
jgi:hypothetical protein